MYPHGEDCVEEGLASRDRDLNYIVLALQSFDPNEFSIQFSLETGSLHSQIVCKVNGTRRDEYYEMDVISSLRLLSILALVEDKCGRDFTVINSRECDPSLTSLLYQVGKLVWGTVSAIET